jgi:hypothetical protein
VDDFQHFNKLTFKTDRKEELIAYGSLLKMMEALDTYGHQPMRRRQRLDEGDTPPI